MIRRLFAPAVLVMAVLAVTAHTTTRSADPASLTVHEWGTFTSIAGEDGRAVNWAPLAGPTDLPCFVHEARYTGKSWLPGKCRMETPVLYFYTPEALTVDVKVRFPQGFVTEWFPRAAVAPYVIPATPARGPSAIQWNDVKVQPGASAGFPTEAAPNHYYAARNTAAAPLQVGDEREKLLFYRGVGSFEPPIAATVSADGAIAVSNADGDAVGRIILFENRGGRTGYRVGAAVKGEFRLERPTLGATETPPYVALEQLLVSRGLFAAEAKAMVDTWRDSWFEEGTRLLYIVSRPRVDAILPLEVDPTPTAVARVFVGRLELVTPEMLSDARSAIARNDQTTLRRYGRFFQPIVDRIRSTPDRGGPGFEDQLRAVYRAWRWPAGACAN